jgi:O-antigen ligase
MQSAVKVILTFVQSLIFFWVCCNLFRDSKVARNTMLAFLVSATLVSILATFGIGASELLDNGNARSSFGGRDPNENALIFAWACLLAVACFVEGRGWVYRTLSILALPPLVLGIAKSGSRTAIVVLALGLAALFALRWRVLTRRPALGLAVVCAITAGFFAVASLETMQVRFSRTFEDGDTSNRDDILRLTWDMFKDRPILGWGEGLIYQELSGRISGIYSDRGEVPHNQVLWALATTGILGAVLLAAGVLAVGKRAWNGRNGAKGVGPFILLLMLCAAALALNVQYLKAAWLILAYAATKPLTGQQLGSAASGCSAVHQAPTPVR